MRLPAPGHGAEAQRGRGPPARRHPRRGGALNNAAVAAAEAGARHNIRPLISSSPASLRRAVEALGGTESLGVLAHRGAMEALAIEGLRSDQTRVIERTVRELGGIVITSAAGDRAVVVGPVAALAGLAVRLIEWGQQTELLGGAISAAMMGQQARPPLRCGDHLLEFGPRTLIMGVVNVTPDSFSGDGVGGDVDAAVELAEAMAADGADLIDVGGESTRPNSAPVDAEEELSRVLPVVRALAGRLAVPVSIDSRKAEVATAAVAAGATIVNDIWGLRGDPAMAEVVAANPHIGLVVMHNQRGHDYGDLVAEVSSALWQSLVVAARQGIAAERVIVDPGFGFGKTPAQNLELTERLGELRGLGRPLLFGPSRKSTIGMILDGAPPELRIEGTVSLCVLGVAAGAEIIRVHDVAEVRRGIRVADAVLRGIPAALRNAPAPGPTQ